MTSFEFEAIGTKWKIDIKKKLSQNDEDNLVNNIKGRINIFDQTYSRFRKDSLVTKMSEHIGEYVLPPDADEMIKLYKVFYDVSNGLVTPLIGNVLMEAGYNADYSFVPAKLNHPKLWNEVLEWKNPNLIINEPVMLDFGAGGKGYLVDIVSEIIENNNIFSYCVDAGGDIRHRDAENRSLKVGLENPYNSNEVIGVWDMSNASICGSGINRRKWLNFHHIINPKTLVSPDEILSVWVVAETTILADLLATALYFVKNDILSTHFQFEYLILYKNFSIEKSQNFRGEIFTQ